MIDGQNTGAGTILLTNASILPPEGDSLIEDGQILVREGRILQVASGPEQRITSGYDEEIDCQGLTLMPGLIDCHVHVATWEVRLGDNALLPDSLVAARATVTLREMLMRGFTTVRDAGGADQGLVLALEEGTILGPRLIICGQALSQSGGHADLRSSYDNRDPQYYTRRLGSIGRVCDGDAEVRRAAREEIKGGAKFLKIMANGGVASPNDPIDFLGFSRQEITAIVEEAENAQTYVAAHLYTDEAIRRAVELGVRSIEHCNLVSPETAALMAEKGAIACPTVITLVGYSDQGASLGISPENLKKGDRVRDAAFTALKTLSDANVTIAYGTDLTVRQMQGRQSEEFRLRAQVLTTRQVIDSATIGAAKLLRMDGEIGVIAPNACADIIGVRGNPLEDIELLANPEEHVVLIMKGGVLVKR